MSILTKETAMAGIKDVDQTQHDRRMGVSAGTRPDRGAFYPYRRATPPLDWHRLLPDAETYYRRHVTKLGRANRSGWAQGHCPFHEDHEASLSVNFEHGGWRCFAGCGAGDLVSFHQRLMGQGFREAIADLTGARV